MPIVVLSARQHGRTGRKYKALDLGADDYVTKPFAMNELMARLRAAVRRGREAAPEQATIAVGDLVVDLARKRVARNGADVRLTPTEWSFLELLARNLGRLVPREQILREVWAGVHEHETHYPKRLRRPAAPQARGRPRPPAAPDHQRGPGLHAGAVSARRESAQHARARRPSRRKLPGLSTAVMRDLGKTRRLAPAQRARWPNRASPAYRMSRLRAAPAYKTRRLDLARGEAEDGQRHAVGALGVLLVVRPGLEQHRPDPLALGADELPRVHGDGATTEGDRRVLGGAQVGHHSGSFGPRPVRADDVPRVLVGQWSAAGWCAGPPTCARHLEDELVEPGRQHDRQAATGQALQRLVAAHDHRGEARQPRLRAEPAPSTASGSWPEPAGRP